MFVIVNQNNANILLSWGGRGGGGRGWWGEWGGYMALYGCACRMAPFFSAAKYMIGPFFSAKSI